MRLTGVSEWKSPKTEIRSSVGDTSKGELNSVDGLVDEGVSEAELMVLVVVSMTMSEINGKTPAVTPTNVERLHEQHDRNRDEGGNQKNHLDQALKGKNL